MDFKDFALGFLTATFIFGAYLLGLFHGQGRSIDWRQFFTSMRRPLTRQGFLWAMMLPLLWLGLYFSLAIHLRAGLGHWPTSIGQSPGTWLFALHAKVAWELAVVIGYSLMVLPAVIVISLLVRRWRYVGVYALSYGAAVFAAYLLMNLAPASFVHWWWD